MGIETHPHWDPTAIPQHLYDEVCILYYFLYFTCALLLYTFPCC